VYNIAINRVQNIIEKKDTIDNVAPFVDTAKVLLDNYFADEDISDTLLSEIGCWLAAHFYTLKNRQSGQESSGDVQVRYYAKIEMGLRATSYGQQAIAMDPTGILDNLDKRKHKVSIEVI
jgi:hypothetical protein